MTNDPIEIGARTAFIAHGGRPEDWDAYQGDEPYVSARACDEWRRLMGAAITALEDAGWRLVGPNGREVLERQLDYQMPRYGSQGGRVTMSEISEIKPKGSYLAALELWREPDGVISARLTDVPVPVIQSTGDTVDKRMIQVATWLFQGAIFLVLNAAKLRDLEK